MRIGLAWVPDVSNSNYRAIDPGVAMADRGHDVVGPANPTALPKLERVADCDVVHVYRRMDTATIDLAARLMRSGVAVTYDNDDDLARNPGHGAPDSAAARQAGRRMLSASTQLARAADAFTTTTEAIAARYRAAGVLRIAVIGNHLRPNVARPRVAHEGVVVGWLAGREHWLDLQHVPIVEDLRRLLATHDGVRVECIGVDLGLGLDLGARYRHDSQVGFDALPARTGAWDVAIAPLADTPFNRARSDIKLKEYAASGVPWLASPVGPYLGLGEEHGGRLVPDDGWFDALERLVTSAEVRERLGANGLAWAQTQTIDAVAYRWEEVFVAAAERARGRRAATATARPGPSRGRRSPRGAR